MTATHLRAALPLFMLVLAACAPAEAPAQAPPAAGIVSAEMDSADNPAPEASTPTAPPTEPSVATGAAPQPTEFVVKTGLVATDPSSVNLASGSPKLVEFFAFW